MGIMNEVNNATAEQVLKAYTSLKEKAASNEGETSKGVDLVSIVKKLSEKRVSKTKNAMK